MKVNILLYLESCSQLEVLAQVRGLLRCLTKTTLKQNGLQRGVNPS